MRIAKSCNSQRKKAPPGRYCVRPLHREVMLVTRTAKVVLTPDLGFECALVIHQCDFDPDELFRQLIFSSVASAQPRDVGLHIGYHSY
jgi:hypothetical protein